MKKIYIVLAILGCITLPHTASAQHVNQDSTWTFGGNITFNLNQTAFSNWASGGEAAVGGNIQLDYSADYKKEKHISNNRLELAYGVNYTETTGSRKTNDKIYLSSLYGYNVAKNLYVSGLTNFQTQFTEGFSYDSDSNKTLVSAIMAPGYLTVGGGLTWTPKEWFTATFTPATWRETFVLNETLSDEGSYGVEAGFRTWAEAGANLQLEVTKDIMKNVALYSRLILFSNYLDKPENVDANWEVMINMTINKWLSASISTNLLYDDNIDILRNDGTTGPALQFKENIGIGIQIKL